MATILVIFGVIVLPLVAVFSFLVVFPFNKIAKKKLKFRSMFLATSVISYLLLFGDYHLSNLVFKYYCSDKELVGQFVYEKVELSNEMFVELDEDANLSMFESSMLINNRTEVINEDKFRELYEYHLFNRTTLSIVGPIYQIETIVKRKADGKILGKAKSLKNKLGWLSELNLWWLNTGESCPIYRGNNGDRVANSDAFTLIDRIFQKVKSK